MSSQDEARAARIQKYKEERRKQLTAKTATLFSTNVTDRRTKKAPGRALSEDTGSHLKSSSEINLNTSATSVPIRTTRTSRLRAAAASSLTDSYPSPRHNKRTSSVTNLAEEKNRTPRSCRLIDRDKTHTRRKSQEEKENLKSASTSCFAYKDIGAIRKTKHSINKSLEKDKKKLVCSPIEVKDVISVEKDVTTANTEKTLKVNGDEILDEILSSNVINGSPEKPFEDLFNDLVVDDNEVQNVMLNDNDVLDLDVATELNIDSHKSIPAKVFNDKVDTVVNSVGVISVVGEEGLSSSVCVRKVEKFSELLSNLCSPCEAELLFEDLVAETGLNESVEVRLSGPAPVCRRAQPAARVTSTPKKTVAEPGNDGSASKTKTKTPVEPRPKTESSLPSSRISPKNILNTPIKSSQTKLSPPTSSSKPKERRRSSDGGTKPSCIPLSKRTAERNARNSSSPVKLDLTKETSPRSADKPKQRTPSERSVARSPDKGRGDDTSRRYRAQRDSQNVSEKYHNSKKRLTSLENNSSKDANDNKNSPKSISDNTSQTKSKLESDNLVDADNMSTLHERRPVAGGSRLSQELDSLAALTKQTLDRVNKLSNNLASNKLKLDTSDSRFDALFASTSESDRTNGVQTDKPFQSRGVTERLKDIDTAAQRLIDFEKQSAIFSDLNDTSSQNRRLESASGSCLTPVSILKRKSLLNEECVAANPQNHAIASPPVTFSPSVVEPRHARADRKRQGILKKRRSLDESQVARRRSCSPVEVSFADDDSSDTNKSILKNRRSSLEDVIRNRSPDGQIQGILKRKMSREEEHVVEDASNSSPEPHGILKRKSNSSSSSSTTSSHVSIAQAVLLAAAGGAEIVDDDKESVRPILKKKSFSEERPSPDIVNCDTPRPILKKKSLEHDDHDFERPKKPILKVKRLSSEDGTSSFDLSEDDRSSRRPSLLRSRTSDHSGSECETTVRPILKQRGSSLTRERSQSPRPRLSFCADSESNTGVTNFSSDSNDPPAAGPSRSAATDPEERGASSYPSAVLRRRNNRPKSDQRSKSLAGDVNNELLSILNNRRLKVDETCQNGHCGPGDLRDDEGPPKPFPSIAARIKCMEKALTKDQPSSSKSRNRDRDRFKTQPITVEEMRSITSSLEPGQAGFQAFGPISSFPNGPAESGAVVALNPLYAGGHFADHKDLSPPYGSSAFEVPNGYLEEEKKCDAYGEANFLEFENGVTGRRRPSTLEEIEREVEKVREALDEESRALDEDERQQAEADSWSLNVSCDSGVYNRASSRDSGPHSGEELGAIESQEIKENIATNSSQESWSPTSLERGLITMDRQRKSTEVGSDDDDVDTSRGLGEKGFALGLVKSNSVVARASMWQALQQQAKGTPKPLLRHNRSKARESAALADRFKTQPISYNPPAAPPTPPQSIGLAQSKSTANVLDRDEDAKLDEDDPAKMSLMEKMKMFNSKLTHKPPVSGLPPRKEDRAPRASRLKTMPVLSSQVQEALENNERLCKSMTHEEIPRNNDFQMKMELFRSASAKNTSLMFLRQDPKFRSLDIEESSPQPSERMITPEVRGILKSGTTPVPTKPTLAKGESSEGLKDEGIDSSSDESASSSVSSSEKSCSSDSSEDILGRKPRRFNRKNKLKNSRTDSDLTRVLNSQDLFPKKIQLPGANELKERLAQAKNTEVKPLILGKLHRKPDEIKKDPDMELRYQRNVQKLAEPIQLGKLRRVEKPISPPSNIAKLNQEARNKFFRIDNKKSIEELTAAVRRYIPTVSKSVSVHTMEVPGSGSDGESSGGREVRQINNRVRHRGGGVVQRSATHADMPNRGSTIADRLAALQAAGANDWRARVCRLSPEKEDSKAIERAKNRINENLNAAVDDKKKVLIDDNELGSNILADRRNKLETAAQGWRKRVPQNDATNFTVAGRLERDKVVAATPPPTPPPGLPPAPSSPGIPTPNKFRSRKQPSPPNGFAPGPLRSASCAVVNAAAVENKVKHEPIVQRDAFKRSLSLSENISRVDDATDPPNGVEKSGQPVRVPRADNETFQAFFTPVLEKQDKAPEGDFDVDLDAIDSGSRQLLASDWARRAKRERKHAASRNPLRALAARTDIKEEYSPLPNTIREQYIKEKATANCGLAAEALAALATKEDFSSVALRSAAAAAAAGGAGGAAPAPARALLHVKGRRRVQTRLVEPVHSSVNRGDCFVLLTGNQLFLYIGFYANVIERNRSTDIAQHILNTKDLGCKTVNTITIIDEQTKNYSNKHWNQFWSALGVTEGIENYKPIETGHADEDEIYESCMIQTNMCYEVMDDELVPIKEYWGQMPKIAMLHQSKTIVFDFGSEMYIWYGKNVPLESRRRAAQLAQELFDDGYNYEDCHINPLNASATQGARAEQIDIAKASKSRPEWAILSKVTQHMETILFKEKFLDWPDYTRVIRVKHQDNKTNSMEINPVDGKEMWTRGYQDPDLILEGSHLGRGTHYYDKETMRHFDIRTKSVCKWIVQESDYQMVQNEAEIGEFFSADSYIIRWEYQMNVTGRELNGKPSKHNLTGRDRCAYFCWQGRDASSNEKGTAALLTVELDKEKGPQIRVAQGSEPPAFLNLFQGNLSIHQGKKDVDKSRYRLFVTRGNVTNEAYLLEVPCSVRQLRSRGSLLLVDTEKGCLHIWHGLRSMKHTKNIAIELANKLIARKSTYLFGANALNVKINEVKEGEEPKEVLEALGGNKQYYNSVLGGPKEGADVTPRLFHFTDLGGQFEAIEVLSPLRHEHLVTPFPFEQKDLYSASQPGLFLLDSGEHVWVWQGWWPRGEDGELEPAERNTGVGAFAGRWQALRAAALRTAESYWSASRGVRGDVRVVAAGLEPVSFTDLFDTWTERDDAAEANIAHGWKAGAVLSGACELSRLTARAALLPLAELQRRPLPDHVDPQHLERHLSSPDFLEAFGMNKEDFTGLPAWKQTNMKKDVGLF